MNYLNKKDLEHLYYLLNFDEKNLSETRCINPESGVINREYQQDFSGFLQWCKLYNTKGNCYVGRSPRSIEDHKHITRTTTLTLDIDPIREKGKKSNDKEIQECIDACRKIGDIYTGYSLAFTGNGCLLLWTSDKLLVEDDNLFALKVARFQDDCRILIQDYKGVRIDNTQDCARLIKAVGTVSVKGGYRPTRFLRVQSNRGAGEGVFRSVLQLSPTRPNGGILVQPVYGNGNTPAVNGQYYHEGTRNAYLASIAGSLRRRGASNLAIMAALIQENNEKCKPSLHVDEVRNIASSISRYQPENKVLEGTGKVYKIHTPENGTDDYLQELTERGKEKELELPTGIGSIDKHTRGLRRGEVYVVAAHPKCGKTSYLLNIAYFLLGRGKSVLKFSTEMGKREIWDRLYSIATGINGEKFSSGKLDTNEMEKIKEFSNKFKSFRFSVFDGFSPDLDMVKSVSEQMKPDVIIFDHIQHIENGEETKALAGFVKGLKNLAMQLNCAVLVSSQFRRPTRYLDAKNGKLIFPEPTIFDLKGSGTIEQEAAFVLLLHPTGEYVDSGVSIVKAKLDANRFGGKHEGFLYFHENITTFKEN